MTRVTASATSPRYALSPSRCAAVVADYRQRRPFAGASRLHMTADRVIQESCEAPYAAAVGAAGRIECPQYVVAPRCVAGYRVSSPRPWSDVPEERYANAAALGEDLRRFQPRTRHPRSRHHAVPCRQVCAAAPAGGWFMALTTLLGTWSPFGFSGDVDAGGEKAARVYALQEGKSRDAMLNYVTELISGLRSTTRSRADLGAVAPGLASTTSARRSGTTMRSGQRIRAALSGAGSGGIMGERRTALRATLVLALRPGNQSGEPLCVWSMRFRCLRVAPACRATQRRPTLCSSGRGPAAVGAERPAAPWRDRHQRTA